MKFGLSILLMSLIVIPVSAEETKEKLTLFSILGYINEYIGRPIEAKPDLIEFFSPHETENTIQFEKLMRKYFKLNHRNYTVSKHIGPQGHIRFTDPWMAGRINEYYKKDPCFNKLPSYPKSHIVYNICRERIVSQSRECLLAYLQSSFRRHGKSKTRILVFANAPVLAATTAAALKKVGARTVRFYMGKGGFPLIYRVYFSPVKEIEEECGPLKRPSEIDNIIARLYFEEINPI